MEHPGFESRGAAPRTGFLRAAALVHGLPAVRSRSRIRGSPSFGTPQLRYDLVYPYDGRWRVVRTIPHGLFRLRYFSGIVLLIYIEDTQERSYKIANQRGRSAVLSIQIHPTGIPKSA